MAHDPKTEAWLASRRRGDWERLEKEEKEVADLWWETLSVAQEEVYQELLTSHVGLAHLNGRLTMARLEARRREGET